MVSIRFSAIVLAVMSVRVALRDAAEATIVAAVVDVDEDGEAVAAEMRRGVDHDPKRPRGSIAAWGLVDHPVVSLRDTQGVDTSSFHPLWVA